ncbi:uncharacterized protein RAG0_00800 [Rhynchosporium agropyri]|uniref:Uncharacterized protein n=1 Tax=Rhynchosporium agropyri TaxID=914238 RepID=A0A1E1JUN4_9HELO|nr:uncharacterized protein RAG0_00800 [Rhynchosporium agropyri]
MASQALPYALKRTDFPSLKNSDCFFASQEGYYDLPRSGKGLASTTDLPDTSSTSKRCTVSKPRAFTQLVRKRSPHPLSQSSSISTPSPAKLRKRDTNASSTSTNSCTIYPSTSTRPSTHSSVSHELLTHRFKSRKVALQSQLHVSATNRSTFVETTALMSEERKKYLMHQFLSKQFGALEQVLVVGSIDAPNQYATRPQVEQLSQIPYKEGSWDLVQEVKKENPGWKGPDVFLGKITLGSNELSLKDWSGRGLKDRVTTSLSEVRLQIANAMESTSG